MALLLPAQAGALRPTSVQESTQIQSNLIQALAPGLEEYARQEQLLKIEIGTVLDHVLVEDTNQQWVVHTMHWNEAGEKVFGLSRAETFPGLNDPPQMTLTSIDFLHLGVEIAENNTKLGEQRYVYFPGKPLPYIVVALDVKPDRHGHRRQQVKLRDSSGVPATPVETALDHSDWMTVYTLRQNSAVDLDGVQVHRHNELGPVLDHFHILDREHHLNAGDLTSENIGTLLSQLKDAKVLEYETGYDVLDEWIRLNILDEVARSPFRSQGNFIRRMQARALPGVHPEIWKMIGQNMRYPWRPIHYLGAALVGGAVIAAVVGLWSWAASSSSNQAVPVETEQSSRFDPGLEEPEWVARRVAEPALLQMLRSEHEMMFDQAGNRPRMAQSDAPQWYLVQGQGFWLHGHMQKPGYEAASHPDVGLLIQLKMDGTRIIGIGDILVEPPFVGEPLESAFVSARAMDLQGHESTLWTASEAFVELNRAKLEAFLDADKLPPFVLLGLPDAVETATEAPSQGVFTMEYGWHAGFASGEGFYDFGGALGELAMRRMDPSATWADARRLKIRLMAHLEASTNDAATLGGVALADAILKVRRQPEQGRIGLEEETADEETKAAVLSFVEAQAERDGRQSAVSFVRRPRLHAPRYTELVVELLQEIFGDDFHYLHQGLDFDEGFEHRLVVDARGNFWLKAYDKRTQSRLLFPVVLDPKTKRIEGVGSPYVEPTISRRVNNYVLQGYVPFEALGLPLYEWVFRQLALQELGLQSWDEYLEQLTEFGLPEASRRLMALRESPDPRNLDRYQELIRWKTDLLDWVLVEPVEEEYAGIVSVAPRSKLDARGRILQQKFKNDAGIEYQYIAGLEEGAIGRLTGPNGLTVHTALYNLVYGHRYLLSEDERPPQDTAFAQDFRVVMDELLDGKLDYWRQRGIPNYGVFSRSGMEVQEITELSPGDAGYDWKRGYFFDREWDEDALAKTLWSSEAANGFLVTLLYDVNQQPRTREQQDEILQYAEYFLDGIENRAISTGSTPGQVQLLLETASLYGPVKPHRIYSSGRHVANIGTAETAAAQVRSFQHPHAWRDPAFAVYNGRAWIELTLAEDGSLQFHLSPWDNVWPNLGQHTAMPFADAMHLAKHLPEDLNALVTSVTHYADIAVELGESASDDGDGEVAADIRTWTIPPTEDRTVQIVAMPAASSVYQPRFELMVVKAQLEKTRWRSRSTAGTEEQPGLEAAPANRVLQSLAAQPFSAASVQGQTPLRFIADTSGGLEAVMRLAQLGAVMRLNSVPIEFAAVATEDQLGRALAALPTPEARAVLASRTYTYDPGNEESYSFALEMAQLLVPELDPTYHIHALTTSVRSWFLQALDVLGVWELRQDFRDVVDTFLQSA